MRRRLIIGFIGVAILVVGLYGAPRAYIVAHLIQQQEQHRVDDTATLLKRVLDQRTTAVTTASLDALNGDYEWIVVRHGGTRVTTTGAQARPPSGDLTATRTLADGGTLTVGLSEPVVSSAISNAIVPLILLGLGIIVVAVAAIYLIAPRLAAPFQQLARAARGLGQGDLHPDLPQYRTPELRAVAEALTASGQRIEEMLAHERTLAVHASHELRTPIAALRLELEDLALWPETAPTVAAELQRATGELDRLSTAVGDLLLIARQHRERDQADVDLEVLLARTLGRFDGPRRVVLDRNGALLTRLDPVAMRRLVDAVVEPLLAQGAQRVRVSAEAVGTHLEVTFSPEGASSVDLDLTSATEWAAALDGQIARKGSSVILRLPMPASSPGQGD